MEERLLSLPVTDDEEDAVGDEHEEYHDEVGDFGESGVVDCMSTSQSPVQSG